MMHQYVGIFQYQKIHNLQDGEQNTGKQQEKKEFWSFMAIWGCCSYHRVIIRIPRLLRMMNQYVGMLRYQKILRQTQFVGCRTKNRQKNKKISHFGHLWPFQGCCSYHTVIVRIPRLLCMINQYVGMLQYQKILKRTHFVGCRVKNMIFMAHIVP